MTDQPQQMPQPSDQPVQPQPQQAPQPSEQPVQPQAQYTPPTYAAPASASEPYAQQQAAPQPPYTQQQPYAGQPYTAPAYATAGPVYTMSDSDSTLRLIAFIFNVLSTIVGAAFILPLAWMIPMTVHSWGIYKGTKANTVAFGVCTLLFLDFVSGILLLVSKKDA